jgi:hypothetical protein
VEVVGYWRRLHYQELRNLYASPNVIRVIKSWCVRWVGHVACVGEMRNGYKILIRKPEGKRLHGRPRHGLEDNIRMNNKEIGWEGVDWIHLAQDRDK